MPSDLPLFDFKTLPKYNQRLFKSLELPPEEDAWICSSALQKTIRRGHEKEALTAAAIFHQLQPHKFWKRLRVIALEDIGVANLPLCQLVLKASSKRWREEGGGDVPVLASVVAGLCRSPKSRVANDLLCIGNTHPAYREVGQEYAVLSTKRLVAIYRDQERPIIERLMAGRYVSGYFRRVNVNMLNRAGNAGEFFSLHDPAIYPADLLSVIRQSLSDGEGHSRALALAWEHKRGLDVGQKDEVSNPIRMIGYWPSETYDAHTSLGKFAYKRLVNARNPISAFLKEHIDQAKHIRALSWTMFAIEGQLLNQREVYKGLQNILDEAHQAYVASSGLIGTVRKDFFDLVRENIELVHAARARVVSSHYGSKRNG